MATIDVSATDAARRIALQMLQERGRGAVLVGVARVDAALEHLLQALMDPPSSRGMGCSCRIGLWVLSVPRSPSLAVWA